MDVNWCLTCECSFEGSGPYCSPRCQPSASYSSHQSTSGRGSEYFDDEDVIYHHVDDASYRSQWIGNGTVGIRAWAAAIEPCSPTTSSTISSSSSSCYSSKYSSPDTSTSRLPKLIQAQRKPGPPALGISTIRPSLPSPSRPILTLQTLRTSNGQLIGTYSTENLSVASGATESSLATPVSASPALPIPGKKSTMFSALASHVRSFVSTPSSVMLSHRPSVKHLDPPPLTKVDMPIVDISSSLMDEAEHLSWQFSGTTIVVDGPTSARKFSDVPSQYRLRGRNLSRA